ncbi:MAG: MBL fold metallo-hydrolase [Planctomycetota bacterium]|nr:MBL fold metallo-hydrolase [Planctomycetota bacterium]
MALKITSTGNAGVFLENAGGGVYIDSFFHKIAGSGSGPAFRGSQARKADLILISHAHPDHVDPAETIAAAQASGAALAGPAAAMRLFKGRLPDGRLIELESPERQRPPSTASARMGGVSVTSFRTYHASGHNSYLVEMGDARVYHDADNEHASRLNPAALGQIDLLILCPWAGSGAERFVRALAPAHWLLCHLTDEEILAHQAGKFLPGLVDPVPPGVLALAGGQSLEI